MTKYFLTIRLENTEFTDEISPLKVQLLERLNFQQDGIECDVEIGHDLSYKTLKFRRAGKKQTPTDILISHAFLLPCP
jgi:hypothetical protein